MTLEEEADRIVRRHSEEDVANIIGLLLNSINPTKEHLRIIWDGCENVHDEILSRFAKFDEE